jgi:hypothetical protein
MTPILEADFHHDGRGPELQRVIWNGVTPAGFDYFNPEDEYIPENLRHLLLVGVEAYSYAGEEVHAGTASAPHSRAAVFDLGQSPWFRSFNPRHLKGCSHFQIMFYDQIFDVICREIRTGRGPYPAK